MWHVLQSCTYKHKHIHTRRTQICRTLKMFKYKLMAVVRPHRTVSNKRNTLRNEQRQHVRTVLNRICKHLMHITRSIYVGQIVLDNLRLMWVCLAINIMFYKPFLSVHSFNAEWRMHDADDARRNAYVRIFCCDSPFNRERWQTEYYNRMARFWKYM